MNEDPPRWTVGPCASQDALLQVLREAGKPLDVGELAKQLSPLTDGTYRDRVRGARRQSVRQRSRGADPAGGSSRYGPRSHRTGQTGSRGRRGSRAA